MGKPKKRYQSKGNTYPTITLTGRSYLLHRYENDGAPLEKGDVLFYLHTDTIGREQDNPGYEDVGGAGYLKAMVYDGKDWQYLIMDDVFAEREHHFSKKERPLDTYAICAEVVKEAAGTVLQRTYRLHYGAVPESEQLG